MINTLTPVTLHPSASSDAHDLALQFNQRLQEIELHLASLKGSDGQSSSIASDLDMQGKRITNVRGNPKSLDDPVTQRQLNAALASAIPPVSSASAADTVTLAQVNNAVQTGLKSVWPVGSIFISIVATNPATLLGFGTWSQVAQGQFLVGQLTADPDFGTVEAAGGAKTHTSSAPSATAALGVVGAAVASDTHTHTVNNLPPFYVVYAFKRTA